MSESSGLSDWKDRNARLITQCFSASATDVDRLVNEFIDNLEHLPPPLRQVCASPDSLGDLEALCRLRAFESAMTKIFGEKIGYMLSRSLEGRAYATVHIPGVTDEASFEAADLSIAMLGALALAFHKADLNNSAAN